MADEVNTGTDANQAGIPAEAASEAAAAPVAPAEGAPAAPPATAGGYPYQGQQQGGYQRRGPGGPGGGGGAGKRFPRRKVCAFCVDKLDYIDYKDTKRIRKFVSERGKIMPRRITGNCAAHQRMLTVAIKRARVVALVAFKTD